MTGCRRLLVYGGIVAVVTAVMSIIETSLFHRLATDSPGSALANVDVFMHCCI